MIATLAAAAVFAGRGSGDLLSSFLILSGLMVSLLLLGVGGAMRVLHRLIWRKVLQPWALGRRLRQAVLVQPQVGPLLQWWLHLTPDGGDRDGGF